ncbi:hypothetical protein ABZZ79_27275 [Streptomyces sp. NPDC006458]|uniref:HAMP domain-containing protein n=1 Tax=Streptomyces sp. NPDC006458 TaxID=3154302 RepID=UPI0033BD0B02
MTGRRRTRPRRRPKGQPRTLRTRLVVASVTLIAVVCAVIGTVTTLALRSHLYEQLDGQLREAAARAGGFGKPPGAGPDRPPGQNNTVVHDTTLDLDEFVKRGPQPTGTVIAEVRDGLVTDARIGEKSDDSTDISGMAADGLDSAQQSALNSVAQDGEQHTVDLPGLGRYRVEYRDSADGTRGYYVALPTEEVSGTLGTLILIEASVTAAALVAAGMAGTVMVGVATRPLRRVAATATRVSELPLHAGEVNLDERVPESECDPHTEVGRVGAALNTPSGSIVTAGPAVSGGRGGFGGGMPGGGPGGGGFPGQGGQNRQGGQQGGRTGRPPTGGFGGGLPGQNGQNGQGQNGQGQNNQGLPTAPGGTGGDGPTGGGRGGMGGLLGGADVDDEARKLLEADAEDHTWAAAAIGAQNAASYQLATGEPVMAIGGFNGTDPCPTLAEFKKYVAEGKIHYFVSGGGTGGGAGPGGGGRSSTSSQISEWVQDTFKEVTVGSATFYDLTREASGG